MIFCILYRLNHIRVELKHRHIFLRDILLLLLLFSDGKFFQLIQTILFFLSSSYELLFFDFLHSRKKKLVVCSKFPQKIPFYGIGLCAFIMVRNRWGEKQELHIHPLLSQKPLLIFYNITRISLVIPLGVMEDDNTGASDRANQVSQRQARVENV